AASDKYELAHTWVDKERRKFYECCKGRPTMTGLKSRARRMVWSFLLAAAACIASGAAFATCQPQLPASGIVCFMTVQPIDVGGPSGLSTRAPFNTTSITGVGSPATACSPGDLNCGNPIGFGVNPATGTANPTSGGVDVTRALLNQIGVDLTWLPMATYNSPP